MGCQYNIYTGNHGKREGIEDYLTLLRSVLGSRGLKVDTSPVLQANATNIIIDEFTNCVTNRSFTEFRRCNPASRGVLILTEFWERKFGVETLNNHGGLFDAALIALFNVYLRHSRFDFPSVRVRDVAILVAYCPILAAYFALFFAKYLLLTLLGRRIGSPVALFLRDQHRLIYFHMRYLGLAAHLRYADAVITSHELIFPGFCCAPGICKKDVKHLGKLHPELDEDAISTSLMKDKELSVEITGTITSYRRAWMKRLNLRLKLMGVASMFGNCRVASGDFVASKNAGKRAAYSLHPPQTRRWPYCSPTRIFRALQIDHNLPVLTKHFGQDPIEDVGFLLEQGDAIVRMADLYTNRAKLLDYVLPRIRNYNAIAKSSNDRLVEALVALTEQRD